MVNLRPSHLVSKIIARGRGAILIVAAIVIATTAVSAIPQSTAKADSLGGLSGLTSGYGTNVSSCAINTVGWVICPVMRSIAYVADYGFAFINENFLKIEYGLWNSDTGVYKAWELMRNIANALFVLAFMVIVYAQITGKGNGGYSIKRILPRLIIGAILLNVSYYICVAAIDISNIVGTSVLGFMNDGIAKSIGQSAMSISSAQNGISDGRLTEITSAILAKQGTVWILLAPVAAITVSIALICAVGLVLLIMRKVVIAMLVLLSPLVFVTYLLPNTEQYFQQWLRLSLQLLLLYPVIALLLGTGQIISATIVNVGSGSDTNYKVTNDNYNSAKGGSGSATTDLAAAGAAVLPLLGTWYVLKSLSSVMTSAGTRVVGSLSKSRSKEEEAKLKAKLETRSGESTNQGLPKYDRKPAFSRLRRRRSAYGEVPLPQPTGGSGAKAGKPGSGITASAGAAGATSAGDMALNAPGLVAATTEEEKKHQEEIENAKINSNTPGSDSEKAIKTEEQKKNKTAKDIFNNMNKSRQMGGQSGGGNGSGNNNGGQSGGNSPQPAAPGGQFKTPGIAQSAATATAPAPTPAQSGPMQVVTIPVQVDAASFLKPGGAQPHTDSGLVQPPPSETESKAKERAQKYLFDAQRDIDDSTEKLDELTIKRNELEKKQDDKEAE